MYSYERAWLNSPQFKKLEGFIDSTVNIEDPAVLVEVITNRAIELNDEFREEMKKKKEVKL